MILGTEPIAVGQAAKEFISALVKGLVIFGIVQWSGEQTAAVMLIVDAGLAMALIFLTRKAVTPASTPTLKPGTVGTIAGTAETFQVPEATTEPIP